MIKNVDNVQQWWGMQWLMIAKDGESWLWNNPQVDQCYSCRVAAGLDRWVSKLLCRTGTCFCFCLSVAVRFGNQNGRCPLHRASPRMVHLRYPVLTIAESKSARDIRDTHHTVEGRNQVQQFTWIPASQSARQYPYLWGVNHSSTAIAHRSLWLPARLDDLLNSVDAGSNGLDGAGSTV